LTDPAEFLHGTDPRAPDTDGDRMPDGDEVRAGTRPLDPASRLAFTTIAPVARNVMGLYWTAGARTAYDIRWGIDLGLPFSNTLASNLVGETGSIPVPTNVPGIDAPCFYRLVVP